VQDKRPLLVVDGDSFAHRAYHGLPKTIRRAGNKGGGAIVGFANYLLRFYEAEKPRAVVVGWDTLESPNWRAKEFAGYQAGREFDNELIDQLNVLPTFVAACGFVVASGDRDAFQLASASTTILHPVKAGEIARIGPAEVRDRYGVEPHQVPDFIALRGDPSDRLPGARGVGPKTAASLLKRYPTLEAAISAGSFPSQAEDLRLYRRIAAMDPTAPLPPIPDAAPTWARAAALAREWELKALAERLTLLAKASVA
jgi:DNA polymerase I